MVRADLNKGCLEDSIKTIAPVSAIQMIIYLFNQYKMLYWKFNFFMRFLMEIMGSLYTCEWL